MSLADIELTWFRLYTLSSVIYLFRIICLDMSKSLLCSKWSCRAISAVTPVLYQGRQAKEIGQTCSLILSGLSASHCKQVCCFLGSSQTGDLFFPSSIYDQYLDSFCCLCAGSRASESSSSQPGSEGLCKSLSQLHIRVHFQQLSWTVQSRVPDRSCE